MILECDGVRIRRLRRKQACGNIYVNEGLELFTV